MLLTRKTKFYLELQNNIYYVIKFVYTPIWILKIYYLKQIKDKEIKALKEVWNFILLMVNE